MRVVLNVCYVDLFGKPPESYQIAMMLQELLKEDDIMSLIRQWGENDTEVGDKVYRWMRDKYK